MMANRTRGARGGSDLNRTLRERPATASRTRRKPRKKKHPYAYKPSPIFHMRILSKTKIFRKCMAC